MIRFQADADLNQTILLAAVRRAPGLDFQSALDARLAGLDDSQVLALASEQGRILITHDSKTMPRHFADFVTHSHSAGVVIVPQTLPVSRAAEDLLPIASATDRDEWIDGSCISQSDERTHDGGTSSGVPPHASPAGKSSMSPTPQSSE